MYLNNMSMHIIYQVTVSYILHLEAIFFLSHIFRLHLSHLSQELLNKQVPKLDICACDSNFVATAPDTLGDLTSHVTGPSYHGSGERHIV